MKNYIAILSVLMFLKVSAQQPVDTYEIGTWPDFRASAITYTFDDNTPRQFSVAVPLFDKYNYKATFFVVTNWVKDWEVLNSIAKNGHEVASHTVSHMNLADMPDSPQRTQCSLSKETINSHLDTNKVVTMATPYCASGNKEIEAEYYIAVRGCSGYIESATPKDFMNVSSIVCGPNGAVNSTEAFHTKIDEAVTNGGWCVFLLHGLDDAEDGWSPIQTPVLESSLQYCTALNYKCWVATFGDVSKYIKERDAALVEELSYLKTEIRISVSDTLNDSIYTYPLSISRKLPKGWNSAVATQDGKPTDTFYTKDGNQVYVIFKAVPDAGAVVLQKSDVKVEYVEL